MISRNAAQHDMLVVYLGQMIHNYTPMGLLFVVITPCGFETLDIVVAARFSSSRVARCAICVRALVATSSAEVGSA